MKKTLYFHGPISITYANNNYIAIEYDEDSMVDFAYAYNTLEQYIHIKFTLPANAELQKDFVNRFQKATGLGLLEVTWSLEHAGEVRDFLAQNRRLPEYRKQKNGFILL